MSTQKRKFELFAGLARLGFTYDESAALRRIEMTLQRWGEAECGNGNDCASWGIEREENTGKPFLVTHPHNGKSYRRPIADREAGALRRLAAIVAARNDRNTAGRTEAESSPQTVFAYHQGDCRGCNLYLLTRQQIGADDISSIYTRGLAVCA
jgi:hypothetical protein